MWYNDLPPGSSWASLWSDYTLCGKCSGIRRFHNLCPACGDGPISVVPQVLLIDGREVTVHAAFNGAEGRYEDWIYLQMLQREWERPVAEFDRFAHFSTDERPSARAAVILLFWTYFETRLERLLRSTMSSLPTAVLEDALERYSSIGTRLHRLYRLFFGITYFDDLVECGYEEVAKLLADLHKRRNEFTHGKPQAISDNIVTALVAALKVEHESWISVFNRRKAAGRERQQSVTVAPPVA
jgi:hypothetical protein